eukprot:13133952-Alexandrium_andersonii.AAC.1
MRQRPWQLRANGDLHDAVSQVVGRFGSAAVRATGVKSHVDSAPLALSLIHISEPTRLALI